MCAMAIHSFYDHDDSDSSDDDDVLLGVVMGEGTRARGGKAGAQNLYSSGSRGDTGSAPMAGFHERERAMALGHGDASFSQQQPRTPILGPGVGFGFGGADVGTSWEGTPGGDGGGGMYSTPLSSSAHKRGLGGVGGGGAGSAGVGRRSSPWSGTSVIRAPMDDSSSDDDDDDDDDVIGKDGSLFFTAQSSRSGVGRFAHLGDVAKEEESFLKDGVRLSPQQHLLSPSSPSAAAAAAASSSSSSSSAAAASASEDDDKKEEDEEELAVAYCVGGRLFVSRVVGDAPTVGVEVPVRWTGPKAQLERRQLYDPEEFVHDWGLHPEGLTLLTVVRGQAFTMGLWDGPALAYPPVPLVPDVPTKVLPKVTTKSDHRPTMTGHVAATDSSALSSMSPPGAEALAKLAASAGVIPAPRVRLATYLWDGMRVALVTDASGEEDIEVHLEDGAREARRLRVPPAVLGRPEYISPSPESPLLAVINHRSALIIVDTETVRRSLGRTSDVASKCQMTVSILLLLP